MFIIVLYYIYIHFTVSLVACPDVYVFQLLAPVRRCCFTRALRVIDGLLEDACERVAAVLLDGHQGWVFRALLLRNDSYEVGVLSVGKVLLDVVASSDVLSTAALKPCNVQRKVASHTKILPLRKTAVMLAYHLPTACRRKARTASPRRSGPVAC